MNLSDVDLNLLLAFEALMAEGQVTRAARRMGIGQPAMSDALRRLRVLFGDPLFVRSQGAMRPTPRARAMAPGLCTALAQLRAALGEAVPFAPAEAAATFTLASTDYTTLVLLGPLVARLRAEAPGIDLRIIGYEKDEVGVMLDRGEADLALGVFADPPPGVVRRGLFRDRFVGLARRGHPALAAGPPGAAGFAALDHALVSIRRDDRGAVDAALARAGLSRRIALVVPYMLLLPGILAASDLVAAVPARAADAAADPRLTRFALPVETPAWGVDMLWNPAARTDRGTAWLRRVIAEVAEAVA